MPPDDPPLPPTPDRDRAALDADESRTVERLRALRRELDRMIEDATLTPPDDEHDPDGATVGFERAQLTALVTDAEHRLIAIEAARTRLAAGEADRCVACGGAIGAERRAARPTTDRCVVCAQHRRPGRR